VKSSARITTSEARRLVPFNRPSIGKDEVDAVVRVLESGWLTSGPQVQAFEREFADYVGARHAIAVSSATIGLQAAYHAVGVCAGDEVIVPTLTYCATASAVAALGATPVLADVLPTGHLNPGAVRRALTGATKVVGTVHYAGAASDMDGLIEAAEGLRIVEDAAHAVGATYASGRKVASSGLAVFSFYATKNMTCGEGGMVTTDDDDEAERIRLYAGQGIDKDARHRFEAGEWEYDVVQAGMKANLSDVHAAIGRVQLEKIEPLLARRRQIADRYTKAFADPQIPILRLPQIRPGRHSWHLYVVQVPRRNEFRRRMLEAGIDTSVHFIPLHRMTAFRRPPSEFPVAELLYAGMVSLPLYPAMTDDDVDHVIRTAVNLTTTTASGMGHLYD
jgi:dTDP-4-amino-4,6-dideoxygalactose transaminase